MSERGSVLLRPVRLAVDAIAPWLKATSDGFDRMLPSWLSARPLRPLSCNPAETSGRALYVPLLFFVVFVAWACWKKQDLQFGEFALPWGDHAADDILIYDAKRFRVIHGQHSSVGLYQPGPYILQLAAWSEIVFFDWLRLFSSYLAAQTFAISLLLGAALALALRLWLLVTRDVAVALVAVGVIAATIIATTSADALINGWAVYYWIGCMLMVSTGLAGMLLRGPSWLLLFVFGAGPLTHARIDFWLTLSLVTVTALVLAACFRRLPFSIFSPRHALAYARTNRSIIIGSGIILAVAAVPIVANLILRWPADFPKYLDVAGVVGGHRPSRVARFVLTFIPFSGLWCLFWLLPLWRQEARSQADLRVAAIIVLLSGMLPALVCGWRVVFNLDEIYRYLLFWVSAFVAMSMATTFVYALTFAEARLYRWSGLAIVAVVTAIPILQTPRISHDPDQTRMYFEAINKLKERTVPGRRIGVIRELTPEGWAIWADLVAVVAALNREGSRAVCIDPRSWHLLFHERYRCDYSRDRISEFLHAQLAGRPGGPIVATLPRSVIAEPRAISVGTVLTVPIGVGWDLMLRGDWLYISSPIGEWTVGPEASIVIGARSLPDRFRVELRGELNVRAGTQKVRFHDGAGTLLAEAEGPKGPMSVEFEIDRSKQPDPNSAVIRIAILDTQFPHELRGFTQRLRLGFLLKHVAFHAAREAP